MFGVDFVEKKKLRHVWPLVSPSFQETDTGGNVSCLRFANVTKGIELGQGRL